MNTKANDHQAEIESLHRQLTEARENLRLIQERKAEFVMSTSVPLDLVKEERRLVKRIEELEQRLGEQGEDLRDKELAYLDSLLKRYDFWRDHYTPLAGIAEVRAAVEDGPRLDLPMPFIPPGFEKLVEHGYGERVETRREPVDDLQIAVNEHRRILLLGDPGSGKTTTLWRLVYEYARAAKTDAQAPLPLFVRLGGYTDDGPFDAYLARHLGPLAPYLETYCASGRLILLLDGLNEMPQARYAERVGRIRDVLDRYPDQAVVVTCRALDYVVKLEQLQKVEVSPLDETRIRDFLHNYLGQTAGERLFSAMGGKVERTSQETLPPLLAMGRNPYLLLMTAQVYASKGELPANRARLFAAFVDTLLGREEERHPAEWIEAERQKTGLAALAYAMQEERGRGTVVEHEWALAHLRQAAPNHDAERLLYLATSATLLDAPGAPDESDAPVRFYHQLLQEYFAACYIVDNTASGTLPCLLSHCADDRWRQVILLTASLVDDADVFFGHFLRALDDLVKSDETLVRFLTWAARKAASIKANYKPAALRGYYCYLDLTFDLPFDRTLDRAFDLNLALDLALARIHELARELLLDFHLVLDLNLVYKLDFARVLALDLNLSRVLVRDYDLIRAHTLVRPRILTLDLPQSTTTALILSQKLGAHALHQALSALNLPATESSREEFKAFADALQTIIIEHRDIGHDWGFTDEQVSRLADYFYAAELLVRCLDLAHVTDRPAIENRLLLPPGWEASQQTNSAT